MTQPQAARPDDDSPQFREIEAAGTTPAAPNRELLEQVVRRTLADQEGGELPPALVDALRELARRQRAQSRPWDAAVVELVEQVLEAWFPGRLLAANSRRKMANEIAEVLRNDPTAGERLRRFWERISEAPP
jgi:hypothetical protein